MHRSPRLAPEPQVVFSHAHALALLNKGNGFKGHPQRWRLHAARRLERLCQDVERVLGAELPTNLADNGPGRGTRLRAPIHPKDAERAARAVGWWQAVIDRPKDFRLLRRLLCKGSSKRRYGSPRNWFPFWQIVERFRHPHAAEYWLGHVLRSADRKLAGFRTPDGNPVRCAWSPLGIVLTLRGMKRPGKAAEWVSVSTLNLLCRLHDCPVHITYRTRLRDLLGLSTALRVDLRYLRGLQPLQIAAALVDVAHPEAVANIVSWLSPQRY